LIKRHNHSVERIRGAGQLVVALLETHRRDTKQLWWVMDNWWWCLVGLFSLCVICGWGGWGSITSL